MAKKAKGNRVQVILECIPFGFLLPAAPIVNTSFQFLKKVNVKM